MGEGALVTIVVAAVSGGVVTKFIEVLVAWFKGRHAREQTGWDKYDSEVRRRRITEEVLHQTRYEYHRDTGRPYDEMPTVPAFRGDNK